MWGASLIEQEVELKSLLKAQDHIPPLIPLLEFEVLPFGMISNLIDMCPAMKESARVYQNLSSYILK